MLLPWLKVLRAWALPTAFVPVALGAFWAGREITMVYSVLLMALASGGLLILATNVLNTYGDFVSGADRAGQIFTGEQLVTGELSPRAVFYYGLGLLTLGSLLGLWLVYLSGWHLLLIAVAGILGAAFYTTGWNYKYRGLGVPIVMLLMGVGMTLGSYYTQTHRFNWSVVLLSLPITCYVGAILHGNDLRDFESDQQAGARTLTRALGLPRAQQLFILLHLVPYLVVVAGIGCGIFPWQLACIALLLPLSLQTILACRRGRFNLLVEHTARLHMLFGILLIGGILWAR